MLDGYIDQLPGNRRTVSTYLGNILSKRPKRKARSQAEPGPVQEEAIEEMPEEDDMIEDTFLEAEQQHQESFFDRVLGFFRGPPRTLSEEDTLGEMEVVDLPELPEEVAAEEDMEDMVDVTAKPSALRMFLDSLLGRTSEPPMLNEDEDARITKLVLYKDRTEKEVRFLLQVVDNLYPRVYKRTRDEFEKSPDFVIYRKIRKRYVVGEE